MYLNTNKMKMKLINWINQISIDDLIKDRANYDRPMITYVRDQPTILHPQET